LRSAATIWGASSPWTAVLGVSVNLVGSTLKVASGSENDASTPVAPVAAAPSSCGAVRSYSPFPPPPHPGDTSTSTPNASRARMPAPGGRVTTTRARRQSVPASGLDPSDSCAMAMAPSRAAPSGADMHHARVARPSRAYGVPQHPAGRPGTLVGEPACTRLNSGRSAPRSVRTANRDDS